MRQIYMTFITIRKPQSSGWLRCSGFFVWRLLIFRGLAILIFSSAAVSPLVMPGGRCGLASITQPEEIIHIGHGQDNDIAITDHCWGDVQLCPG
jgi:hypothetical protein